MNQGSRTGKGTAFMASKRPEELCPGGDRASVVAKKRGNARGVKGGRKVETLNESTKENSTVNVHWTFTVLFSFVLSFSVSTFLPPLTPRALPRFFATTEALSPPGHSSSGLLLAMNAVPFPVRDP